MSRTWVDGVETVFTEAEWARSAAAFLGCGFRLVVPSGPAQRDALAAARQQAVSIAALFNAPLDEVPWEAAEVSGDAMEIVGGWKHQFRGPAGARTTMLRSLPGARQQRRRANGARLPWSVNPHSPLTGLPMISGFEESRALRTLEPDTVGLWWNTDGHLVSSTAGPLLLRADGEWLQPSLASGTVPHFVWRRVAEVLGARPLTVDEQVLATAEALHTIDPLGSIASLGGDEGADELLRALDHVVGTTS